MFKLTLIAMIALALAAPASTALAADAAAGAKINTEKCAKCHGAGGKGDGSGLKKIEADVKPVDWTSKAAMAKLSDRDLATIIKSGGKAIGKSALMPTYQGKLTDPQVADVIAYIRSLAK